MKHLTKLTNQQQQEQQEHAAELQSGQKTGQEFGSVEELLRHDATQTVVPPGIAHRLRQSAADSPAPSRPWWRRWFD